MAKTKRPGRDISRDASTAEDKARRAKDKTMTAAQLSEKYGISVSIIHALRRTGALSEEFWRKPRGEAYQYNVSAVETALKDAGALKEVDEGLAAVESMSTRDLANLFGFDDLGAVYKILDLHPEIAPGRGAGGPIDVDPNLFGDLMQGIIDEFGFMAREQMGEFLSTKPLEATVALTTRDLSNIYGVTTSTIRSWAQKEDSPLYNPDRQAGDPYVFTQGQIDDVFSRMLLDAELEDMLFTHGEPAAPITDDWYTASEAGELLGMSSSKISSMARSGYLDGEKVKGRWRIDPARVAEIQDAPQTEMPVTGGQVGLLDAFDFVVGAIHGGAGTGSEMPDEQYQQLLDSYKGERSKSLAKTYAEGTPDEKDAIAWTLWRRGAVSSFSPGQEGLDEEIAGLLTQEAELGAESPPGAAKAQYEAYEAQYDVDTAGIVDQFVTASLAEDWEAQGAAVGQLEKRYGGVEALLSTASPLVSAELLEDMYFRALGKEQTSAKVLGEESAAALLGELQERGYAKDQIDQIRDPELARYGLDAWIQDNLPAIIAGGSAVIAGYGLYKDGVQRGWWGADKEEAAEIFEEAFARATESETSLTAMIKGETYFSRLQWADLPNASVASRLEGVQVSRGKMAGEPLADIAKKFNKKRITLDMIRTEGREMGLHKGDIDQIIDTLYTEKLPFESDLADLIYGKTPRGTPGGEIDIRDALQQVGLEMKYGLVGDQVDSVLEGIPEGTAAYEVMSKNQFDLVVDKMRLGESVASEDLSLFFEEMAFRAQHDTSDAFGPKQMNLFPEWGTTTTAWEPDPKIDVDFITQLSEDIAPGQKGLGTVGGSGMLSGTNIDEIVEFMVAEDYTAAELWVTGLSTGLSPEDMAKISLAADIEIQFTPYGYTRTASLAESMDTYARVLGQQYDVTAIWDYVPRLETGGAEGVWQDVFDAEKFKWGHEVLTSEIAAKRVAPGAGEALGDTFLVNPDTTGWQTVTVDGQDFLLPPGNVREWPGVDLETKERILQSVIESEDFEVGDIIQYETQMRELYNDQLARGVPFSEAQKEFIQARKWTDLLGVADLKTSIGSKDIAEAFGVKERTVRDWFTSGKVEGEVVGGKTVYDVDSVMGFAETRGVQLPDWMTAMSGEAGKPLTELGEQVADLTQGPPVIIDDIADSGRPLSLSELGDQARREVVDIMARNVDDITPGIAKNLSPDALRGLAHLATDKGTKAARILDKISGLIDAQDAVMLMPENAFSAREGIESGMTENLLTYMEDVLRHTVGMTPKDRSAGALPMTVGQELPGGYVVTEVGIDEPNWVQKWFGDTQMGVYAKDVTGQWAHAVPKGSMAGKAFSEDVAAWEGITSDFTATQRYQYGYLQTMLELVDPGFADPEMLWRTADLPEHVVGEAPDIAGGMMEAEIPTIPYTPEQREADLQTIIFDFGDLSLAVDPGQFEPAMGVYDWEDVPVAQRPSWISPDELTGPSTYTYPIAPLEMKELGFTFDINLQDVIPDPTKWLEIDAPMQEPRQWSASKEKWGQLEQLTKDWMAVSTGGVGKYAQDEAGWFKFPTAIFQPRLTVGERTFEWQGSATEGLVGSILQHGDVGLGRLWEVVQGTFGSDISAFRKLVPYWRYGAYGSGVR